MVEKILKILEAKDFTQADIFNTFTFEERKTIAEEGDYDTAVLLHACQEKKIALLTPSEAMLVLVENPNNEVLIDTLSDYLTQEQIFKYTIENGFGLPTYRLTKTEYIIAVLEKFPLEYDEQRTLICNMDDPRAKVEYMQKYVKKEDYEYIISELNDDDVAISSLKLLGFTDRPYAIASLKSDEYKERFINLMAYGKSIIIAGLESDKRKEYYLNKLNHFLRGADKAKIIASFKDVSYIHKYKDRIRSKTAIYEYFSNSDKRIDDFDIKQMLLSHITKERDILDIQWVVKDQELRNIIISKLRSTKAIKEFMTYSSRTDQDTLLLIDKINSRSLDSALMHVSDPYVLFTLLPRINDPERIIHILEHQDFYPPYIDEYEYLADMFSKRYNLNKEHLIVLLKIVGCSLLNRLTNENIQKAINLDEESFTKYLKIINEKNITVTEAAQNDVLNSFIQREFRIKKTDCYEIFPNITHALDDKDYQKVYELLEEIGKYVSYADYGTTIDELFKNLKENCNEELLNNLKNITTKYLILKRNEFVREELITSKEKSCNKKYDKNAFASFIIKRRDTENIIEEINDYYDRHYTKEEKELITNSVLLRKLIDFKKDPRQTGPLTIEEKQKLPILINVINRAFDTHITPSKRIPIRFEIKETQPEDIVSIMATIDPEQLQNTIFNDPELFNMLLGFIEQYRILGWCGKYEQIAMEADVDYNADSIGELINNFGAIIQAIERESEQKNTELQKTLTRIMDRASLYDTSSRRYSVLFGKENFFYLKANPVPNSSGMKRDDRIAEAIQLARKMYQRKTIPVPSMDKDYTLKNRKRLNVVVGNVTDMINLTLGERTGACMRIGGAGSSLFDYCLTGKNGFHIRFNDPDTGEFVSRVSCFRNGNTLFMNQLRMSVSPKYTSNDLIETVKLVAQELIAKTKDSPMPINNVVINQGYAMASSKMHSVELGIQDVKKGLGTFYSDVDDTPILVASSNSDNSLVPVTLNPKVPEYEPQRSKVKIYQNSEAMKQVAHFHLLEGILAGSDIDSKELVENEDIVTCICGEDWYIAVDKTGKLTQYILPNTPRRKDAIDELQATLEELKSKLTIIDMTEEKKLA